MKKNFFLHSFTVPKLGGKWGGGRGVPFSSFRTGPTEGRTNFSVAGCWKLSARFPILSQRISKSRFFGSAALRSEGWSTRSFVVTHGWGTRQIKTADQGRVTRSCQP